MSCVITDQKKYVIIGTAQIKNSQSEKLLGVTTNTKLRFGINIQKKRRKARIKLKTLGRISPFMNNIKKEDLSEFIFEYKIYLFSTNVDVP